VDCCFRQVEILRLAVARASNHLRFRSNENPAGKTAVCACPRSDWNRNKEYSTLFARSIFPFKRIFQEAVTNPPNMNVLFLLMAATDPNKSFILPNFDVSNNRRPHTSFLFLSHNVSFVFPHLQIGVRAEEIYFLWNLQMASREYESHLQLRSKRIHARGEAAALSHCVRLPGVLSSSTSVHPSVKIERFIPWCVPYLAFCPNADIMLIRGRPHLPSYIEYAPHTRHVCFDPLNRQQLWIAICEESPARRLKGKLTSLFRMWMVPSVVPAHRNCFSRANAFTSESIFLRCIISPYNVRLALTLTLRGVVCLWNIPTEKETIHW